MFRRSFLKLVAGAGLLFSTAPVLRAESPDKQEFRRVFRHDGEKWQEIAWEAMRPGDRVLMMDLSSSGALTSFASMKIPDEAKHGLIDGVPAIQCVREVELLPSFQQAENKNQEGE